MTTDKQLAEVLLRVRYALRDLAVHEKACVLAMAGAVLQAEARSLELGQARPPASDEHYKQ